MKYLTIYKKSRKPNDEPINRFFNRLFSAFIIKLVYKTNLSPNFFTFLSFFIGITSCYFFYTGTESNILMGAIVLQISSIIDCVDGDLARLKNISSRKGFFLDLVSDRIVDSFVFMSIGLGLFIVHENFMILIVSIFGLISIIMLEYLNRVFEFLETKKIKVIKKRYHRQLDKLYCLFGWPIKALYLGRGLFIFLIFFFAIIQQIELGIIFISSYAWFNFLIMATLFYRSL